MIMVTNFQRDDDLMLHSNLNRSTSMVSQFLLSLYFERYSGCANFRDRS
jgi:hypothetical protein